MYAAESGFKKVVVQRVLLFFPIAPVHDNRSIANWHADNASLFSNAVFDHIDVTPKLNATAPFPINHYVFLSGRDGRGAAGKAAAVGTICWQLDACMYLISWKVPLLIYSKGDSTNIL